MVAATNLAASRSHARRIVAAFVLLVLCIGSTIAFRFAGRWLVREDALARAGAIVVLSGAMPARAEEAARIYGMGYAPEVWVSRPVAPSNELAEMGIHYVGEEDYNRSVLIHEGVPDAAIRIFPNVIVNTEQEVEGIAQKMRLEGKTSVIIVTSPPHTRRVKTLWRKLAGKNLSAIVRGAPQDPFDADHWWRDTHDALSLVREYLGLMNAWAGLPVRPHSP